MANEAKNKAVEELVNLINQYPIVGAVNMENLPTPQLQKMRATLRGKVVIRMAKRRLINIAINQAKANKPGLDGLSSHLKGMPALLFTKDNPFALYKTLQANKSSAPIKAGQKASKDIIIPKGPTGFAPGPVIGHLGQVGAAAGIENGKVAIKKDSVVAKEGTVISDLLAGLLTRLNILPNEVGLDLTATYEDGSIFTKSVLHIDEEEFMNSIVTAYRWSFNLAMDSGILNNETTPVMIAKAFNDARALSISQNIITKETVSDILAKAQAHMFSVASQLTDDAKSESLKGVVLAKVASSEPTEKKEEEEKETESQMAVGLGSLFG